MIDHTKPPPRARGLQPSTKGSLCTWSRTAEAKASKDEIRGGEIGDDDIDGGDGDRI